MSWYVFVKFAFEITSRIRVYHQEVRYVFVDVFDTVEEEIEFLFKCCNDFSPDFLDRGVLTRLVRCFMILLQYHLPFWTFVTAKTSCFRVVMFSFLSRSLYSRPFGTGGSLVALLCSFSKVLMSRSKKGFQAVISNSRCGRLYVLYKMALSWLVLVELGFLQ